MGLFFIEMVTEIEMLIKLLQVQFIYAWHQIETFAKVIFSHKTSLYRWIILFVISLEVSRWVTKSNQVGYVLHQAVVPPASCQPP